MDLIRGLDDDPWSLPYRIVLNKLRPAGPTLTEILEEGVLSRVLRQLFPHGEGEGARGPTPGTIAGTSEEEDSRVSAIEITSVIKRKRDKNTAPGRDGIPLRAIGCLPEEGYQLLASLFSRCLRKGNFRRGGKGPFWF